MSECIEAMDVCFGDFSEGKAKTLPRLRYRVDAPDDPTREYFANVHIGAVPSYGMACVRAGSNMLAKGGAPSRKTTSSPDATNWTVIILYDLNNAEPVAFMHESQLSGVRVGATTGVAVDKVARDDVTELGLFGTGRQAKANCEAICTARPSIKRVKVFSPTRENRDAFPSSLKLSGVEIMPVESSEEVVVGADIVCSMNEKDCIDLLKGIEILYEQRGGEKKPVKEEIETAKFAFASVVSTKKINKGEILSEKNLWVKRPGTGEIKAEELKFLYGKIAIKKIGEDEFLKKIDFK